MFLIYLRVKSPITKIVEDNKPEGMVYQFYILLIFDLVFDFQNKKNCKFFKLFSRQYLGKSIIILCHTIKHYSA